MTFVILIIFACIFIILTYNIFHNVLSFYHTKGPWPKSHSLQISNRFRELITIRVFQYHLMVNQPSIVTWTILYSKLAYRQMKTIRLQIIIRRFNFVTKVYLGITVNYVIKIFRNTPLFDLHFDNSLLNKTIKLLDRT